MNRPSDAPDPELTLARVVRAWRNGQNADVPAELLQSASPGLRLVLARLSQRQPYQAQDPRASSE
jgi:hypothetical protein